MTEALPRLVRAFAVLSWATLLAYAGLGALGVSPSGAPGLAMVALQGGVLGGFVATAVGRDKRRAERALVVLGLLAGLYAAEALATWLDARSRWENPLAGEGTPAARLERIATLRKDGIDAVPRISAAHFLAQPLMVEGKPVVPLGGVPGARNVMCNELGFFAEFDADRYGFNNRDDLWDAPAGGLLLIGDSFTEGACVKADETLAARIRAVHPGTINLGASGNDPLIGLATLREYGALVRPRLVLWFFYAGNDLADLREFIRHPVLEGYLKRPDFTQNLVALGPEIAVQQQAFAEFQMKVMQGRAGLDDAGSRKTWPVSIRNALGHLLFATVATRIESASAALLAPSVLPPAFAAVMGEADRTAAGLGARLLFVYIPDMKAIRRGVPEPDRKRVLSAIQGLGVPVIDLWPAIRSHPAPYSLVAGHFNAVGYALVAETVLAALKEWTRPGPPP